MPVRSTCASAWFSFGGRHVTRAWRKILPKNAAIEVPLTVRRATAAWRQLRPSMARIFAFDQIVEAHRFLESNQQFGKVVVRV
ncbi:zinc-binding dehydrogenase [Cupriavidus gilardii]|uniref:zinc-binding dehydrogenase n=1 Tax=Cupriavidus gilardii TaxID=82541 RepID=UPI003F68A79B